MFLNFKVTSKSEPAGYHQPSPNLQKLGRSSFYGVLSLVFALLVGFGSQAHAANPYGLVKWSKNKYKVNEQEGTVFLQAMRVDGGLGDLTVKYGTQAQTAKPGFDYEAAEGTLTWGNGDQSTKLVGIIIKDDNQHEDTEKFNVVLFDEMGNSSSADLGKAAQVEIKDNDKDRSAPPVPEATKKVSVFKNTVVAKQSCSFCPVLFKFTYRIGWNVLRPRSLAGERAEERGALFNNFDPASQAFLVGLQNGLAPFGLNEVEVVVTEDGTYFQIPVYYNEDGMVEGWYQATVGAPTLATQEQEGMFVTPDGFAYVFYADEEGHYWQATLYPMLSAEIASAVQDAFPSAELTQDEGIVSFTLDGDTYDFDPGYFVKISGWDVDPFNVNYVYDEETGAVKYMMVSGQGREQLISAAN